MVPGSGSGLSAPAVVVQTGVVVAVRRSVHIVTVRSAGKVQPWMQQQPALLLESANVAWRPLDGNHDGSNDEAYKIEMSKISTRTRTWMRTRT
jgi:hypothetical protein